jgi:ribosomal protein S12 methylthiotransferase accessory factor
VSQDRDQLWQCICGDCAIPSYHFGTYRAVPPSETLRRIQPFMKAAGITRLANITGLDTIGIPVYQAIRPNSRNISLSNGKGLTRQQAKVSALMESLESYHAEEIEQPTVCATVGTMRRQLDYDLYSLAVVRSTVGCVRRDFDYDPFLPPIGLPSFLNDQTAIDWVRATDLCAGSSTWVPKQLCELNFRVEERIGLPLFRATSNGLASGNTLVEALVHALCEVIERDSIWRSGAVWRDPDRCLVPETIPSGPALAVWRRLSRAQLKTQLVDLSGPTGLPCFEAYISDTDHVAYKGYGCHPSRDTALVRALTEAAQSRLSHIAGTRDDLYRETYRNAPHLPRQHEGAVFSVQPRGFFQQSPNVPIGPWNLLLAELVRRVRAMTGVFPMAVDLTRPEIGIPVVFGIAPGLGFCPPRRR